MKIIGIILVVIGALGAFIGVNMFGDIGVSCIIGSVIGILSGVGFLMTSKEINKK